MPQEFPAGALLEFYGYEFQVVSGVQEFLIVLDYDKSGDGGWGLLYLFSSIVGRVKWRGTDARQLMKMERLKYGWRP